MAGVLDTLKFGGGVCAKLVQTVIFIYALTQLGPIKEHWLDTVPEEATVLTVELDAFWGPVHVFVPTKCSRFEQNDRIVKEKVARSLADAHVDDKEQKDGEAEDSGVDDKKQQDEEQKDGEAEDSGVDDKKQQDEEQKAGKKGEDAGSDDKKFLSSQKEKEEEDEDDSDSSKRVAEDFGVDWDSNATHVIVERCGETMAFRKVSGWHSYAGMTWMSGRDTMEEMRNTRCRMLVFLTITSILEAIVQMFTGVAQKAQEAGYIPLPEGQQPPPDLGKMIPTDTWGGMLASGLFMAVKTLVGQVMGKITTMQSQLALLSLFIVFWNDDYYVTSFIPGKAYLCIAGVYVLGPCGYLLMTVHQGAGACVMCVGVVLGIFVIFCVFIPIVFGYGWYNTQYLWAVGMAPALNSEFHTHFDTAFASEAKMVNTDWPNILDALVNAHGAEILAMTGLEFLTPFIGGN